MIGKAPVNCKLTSFRPERVFSALAVSICGILARTNNLSFPNRKLTRDSSNHRNWFKSLLGTQRRNTEYPERRGHANKFGDQGQPVDQQQVEQREPTPEGAEAGKNGLAMAPFGDGPQTDGRSRRPVPG